MAAAPRLSDASERADADPGQQRLPVLAPVTDYEKLHRIGEGTYGVVCEPHYCTLVVAVAAATACALCMCMLSVPVPWPCPPPHLPVPPVACLPQTKLATYAQARSWRLKKCASRDRGKAYR